MSTPMRRTGAAMGHATAATRKRDEVAQTHGNDVARAAEKLHSHSSNDPHTGKAKLAGLPSSHGAKATGQGRNHVELNTPSGSHRRRWYCRHNRGGDSQAPGAGCERDEPIDHIVDMFAMREASCPFRPLSALA
jgi:hypothetical protein